ncbi:glutathione peroxidase, partial [Francisella tularensis subsp. holarctica]|nr:glutathione peroxidase [Francisella tularensis subsp. holarctica]
NYNVTFPIMKKTKVNGKYAEPLFEYLKERAKGVLGTEAIKWTFTKFLVSKDGETVVRYAPKTIQEDLSPDIDNFLKY